ncbi:uncharacterized protein F4822DRAFT_404547 [Hypoxylon trugodes]|uniref:uncharacterized protein n=1 Tax=Hypoxylon trugodes TaxID=326681 RepID=UPI0021974D84|nr:uncharacterized protein F4822DRAFT_404547 [Hypoxylon trugodes]KAI1388971.1 hypothetical protein F4822DRAFT_404547 [Hypoxylon trugodes]
MGVRITLVSRIPIYLGLMVIFQLDGMNGFGWVPSGIGIILGTVSAVSDSAGFSLATIDVTSVLLNYWPYIPNRLSVEYRYG